MKTVALLMLSLSTTTVTPIVSHARSTWLDGRQPETTVVADDLVTGLQYIAIMNRKLSEDVARSTAMV